MADHHEIVFAHRGKKDRARALDAALNKARANFERKHKIKSDGPIGVKSAYPREHGGLQAVDYFLWALQRLYERRDDRYLSIMWPRIRLVMDIDDTRAHAYGKLYSQRKPLTLACLDGRRREI
ncbi:MAG: hypothetical protein HQL40_03805 [Alphaproteobacteria bacterium]|nr:hypothetical protein [Alphaproteobacteria bacterium]